MKDLISRFKDLAIKIISVKGTVFIIATILVFMGKIDIITWVIFAGVFVGVRTVEKMIRAIHPKKEG